MWFTIKPADDLQLRVGAGIARPVAALATTYLGAPAGAQDFKAQAVRSNAEQPVIASRRDLPGEQCSPLHGYAAISELRLDSSTTAPAGPSLRMTRPDNQTKQSQVLVGAGTARPVAASAATYLGVPLGTQGFEDTTYGVRTNEDSQVLVGAGTARPVAPIGATYLGVPLGTQGFKPQTTEDNANLMQYTSTHEYCIDKKRPAP